MRRRMQLKPIFLMIPTGYWKTIEVTLDDGSVVQVDVPRNSEIPIENIFEGGVSTMDLTPSVPVGTKRSYSVRIKNGQLGAPAMIGTGVSMLTRGKIAEIVAATINAQAAIAIVSVTGILTAISGINAIWGNEGFIVNVNLEYTSRYINKDDHYVYNWSIKGASIRTY